MKRKIIFFIIAFLSVSFVQPVFASDNQLIPVGNIPKTITSECTPLATFVFDLPSSVPPGSANWNGVDLYYVYKDSDGNFAYPRDTYGGFDRPIGLYSRKTEGNRIWYQVSFSFMGSYVLTFVANVGNSTFTFDAPVTVVFEKDCSFGGFAGTNYVVGWPKGSLLLEVEKSGGKRETFINVTNARSNKPNLDICVGLISKSASERFFKVIAKPSQYLTEIKQYERSYPTNCETVSNQAVKTFALSEQKYFFDSPLLFVKYSYADIGLKSPDFVFTVPIVADFPKPKTSIKLECDPVFIEKTSECFVTPQAFLSDGTQVVLNDSPEIKITKMDGSTTSLIAKYGEASKFSIGPSSSATPIKVSFVDGTSLASITPLMNIYSASEQYSATWNGVCKSTTMIRCEVKLNLKVNPGFSVPAAVSLIVEAIKADKSSGELQTSQVRNIDVKGSDVYRFEIPSDPLLKELIFFVKDDRELASTWENPGFVAPVIPFRVSNTSLILVCPNSISGATFNCSISLYSTATTKKRLNVLLESKIDNKPWTTTKTVKMQGLQQVKVSVKNVGVNELTVRVKTKVGADVIYSTAQSWTYDKPKPISTSTPANSSSTYKKFYQIFAGFWDRNPTGMRAAVKKLGGGLGYCAYFSTAPGLFEREYNVTLSQKDKVDMVRACLDFVTSKKL